MQKQDHSVPRFLAPIFLSTGAALVIYVLSGISLALTLIVLLSAALIFSWLIWSRASSSTRRLLKQRVSVGLQAGFLATLAYDASRYLLIKSFDLRFWPFDIFLVFGKALTGYAQGGALLVVAGIFYHLANGLGFATAYSLWWAERGAWAGVLWALFLEVCMVTIYPGWLNIKVFNEFLQVSFLGHVVYGLVLGFVAQHLMHRQPPATDV